MLFVELLNNFISTKKTFTYIGGAPYFLLEFIGAFLTSPQEETRISRIQHKAELKGRRQEMTNDQTNPARPLATTKLSSSTYGKNFGLYRSRYNGAQLHNVLMLPLTVACFAAEAFVRFL